MPNFLNKITFLDSSGQKITLNADNTHSSSVVNAPGTVPLRDNTNRFQVGNTDVSSTDPLVVINKNYVDGRITAVNQAISAEVTARQNKDSSLEAKISAEVTARQNAINALDKSDSAVTGQFVSAVSETNGIISVSRRAIVDGDGVVLKTQNQTITGTKTFASALRCTNVPSSSTDVVRKTELDSVFIQTDKVSYSSDTNTLIFNNTSGIFRVKAKYKYESYPSSESGTDILVFAVSKTYDRGSYSWVYEIKVLQNGNKVIATSGADGKEQPIYLDSGPSGSTTVSEWKYEYLNLATLWD